MKPAGTVPSKKESNAFPPKNTDLAIRRNIDELSYLPDGNAHSRAGQAGCLRSPRFRDAHQGR